MKKFIDEPYLLSKDKVIIEVNDNFIALSRYSEEELLGKTLSEIGNMLRVSSQVELDHLSHKNTIYIFDKFLEVSEVELFCTHIDDNKELLLFKRTAHSELISSFSFIEQICNRKNEIFSIISVPDLIVLGSSKKSYKATNYIFDGREHVAGRKFQETFPNFANSTEDNMLRSIIKNKAPFNEKEYAYINHIGTSYWNVSITPLYENGKVKYLFQTFLDVTQNVIDRISINKKNEEFLFLKTQYEILNNIIYSYNLNFVRCSYPDYKIIDLNTRILNDMIKTNKNIYSISDLVDKNYFKLFGYDNEFEKNVNIKLNNEISSKKGVVFDFFEKKTILNEEKSYHCKLLFYPILGLNKQIKEVVIFSLDIPNNNSSPDKKEKEIKANEESFVNITHEFKTPLNLIYSSNQMIEYYLKSTNKLNYEDQLLNIEKNNILIKQNCYRLINLVNNIIDFSKYESGDLRLNLYNEDIVSTIENIVQSLHEYAKIKGQNIIFDTDIEEKQIAIDSSKIERLILNLVSNAIKFSESGDNIYINILDKDTYVEISVKDEGRGIDQDYLNEIFKRFNQVNYINERRYLNKEGSGIGLSIVKSIAEMHGGRILVKSQLGIGSEFTVQLPAKIIEQSKYSNDETIENKKVEMIDIEFSDIYSFLKN